MVSQESLLARAGFRRLIREFGWQPGTPKPRKHDFPKKKRPIFLKFIELVTPLWVLSPSEIMRVGFSKPPLAWAVFVRSIEVFGWQPVAQNFGNTIFRENLPFFLKFIGPATPIWVL